MLDILNVVYKVLTATCVVIPLSQWMMKRVTAVSPKVESILQRVYELSKWLRLLVSLFR